ncbi:hypothetical protein [Alsobacter sp. R-9]
MISLIPFPYKAAAVLALLAGFCGASWLHGYRTADRSAQIEVQAAAIKSLEAARDEYRRQAEAARSIAQKAAEREQEADAESDRLRDEIARYVRDREQSPPPAECRLSDDDARRLRDLGSAASSAPGRPARGPLDIRPPRASAESPDR